MGIKGLEVVLDVGLGFDLEFSFLQHGRFDSFPLYGFLLPLDLPHAARIRKRRSTLN